MYPALRSPEGASDRKFEPQGCSFCAGPKRTSVLRRRCHVVCFLLFGRPRSFPRFPVSVTQPRVRGKAFRTDCALRSLSLGDRHRMFPFISDKRRRLRATDLNISGVSPPCLIDWHDVYIVKANNKPGNAPAIRMFKREMLS